ncbi:hypothetical protein B0H17DRAFT_1092856 [Mycena rosella]|uniref:Uncharacterized protein n=1 Tax=Mycena rosella TaxID=1033263 RepID=A0AAD7CUT8_MYCRO|nr:hypothetical protein B0H17DRAFT_1092856 [Mycena rosella]
MQGEGGGDEDAEGAFPQPALATGARLKDYQLEGLQVDGVVVGKRNFRLRSISYPSSSYHRPHRPRPLPPVLPTTTPRCRPAL